MMMTPRRQFYYFSIILLFYYYFIQKKFSYDANAFQVHAILNCTCGYVLKTCPKLKKNDLPFSEYIRNIIDKMEFGVNYDEGGLKDLKVSGYRSGSYINDKFRVKILRHGMCCVNLF